MLLAFHKLFTAVLLVADARSRLADNKVHLEDGNLYSWSKTLIVKMSRYTEPFITML